MSKVQVEVYFTDKLESIRVDQWQMEIPNAIRKKPMVEWFKPESGRVKWAGLEAEIKEMDFSGDENTEYNFLFNGPETERQSFFACLQQYGLGRTAGLEEADERTKTAKDYLKEAEKYRQAGNEQMAFQNYKIAAEEYDSPEAQLEIGRCYMKGTGVQMDKTEAVYWYKKASERGVANAQFFLGQCYYAGIGTEKNAAEAVKMYMKAAERKHAMAQYMLGICYHEGIGVQQNDENAARFTLQAAEQGYSPAQHTIGWCYESGTGVQQSDTEAVKWYRKAAALGNKNAQKALERQKRKRHLQ